VPPARTILTTRRSRWRSWWQFGSGTIGDFACHHLDPAFWALKLDQAERFQVEASSYGTTEEVCPAASLIYFDFPAARVWPRCGSPGTKAA